MRKRIALLLALVLAVGLLPACAEEPVELTPGMDHAGGTVRHCVGNEYLTLYRHPYREG